MGKIVSNLHGYGKKLHEIPLHIQYLAECLVYKKLSDITITIVVCIATKTIIIIEWSKNFTCYIN